MDTLVGLVSATVGRIEEINGRSGGAVVQPW